jgi:hypothetical protein
MRRDFLVTVAFLDLDQCTDFMKIPWKQIFVILTLGIGVFIAWEIYKAWSAGATAISDLIAAPWKALKTAWSATSSAASSVGSTITQGIPAAFSLPSISQTQLTNAQNQGSVAASYQPGGTMYNVILASQGQAAADRAAEASAQNAATELSQAQADSSWWGFGNLFSYL